MSCYVRIYASDHAIDVTGGIMFSGCPSVCACVCLAEAFSPTVDFWFTLMMA